MSDGGRRGGGNDGGGPPIGIGAAGVTVSEIGNGGGFSGGVGDPSGSRIGVRPEQEGLASGGQGRKGEGSTSALGISPMAETRSSSGRGSDRGDVGGSGSGVILLDGSGAFVSQEVPEDRFVGGAFLAEANGSHARSPASSLIQDQVCALSDFSVPPAAATAAAAAAAVAQRGAPRGDKAATQRESEGWAHPWSEWETAMAAVPGPEEGRAAALRVGGTRGFFAALTDVLSKSTEPGGGEMAHDDGSGSGNEDGRAAGTPLPLLRVALRTAERVASAAALLSPSPAPHEKVDDVAGSDLRAPAGPPQAAEPQEEAAAAAVAVAKRFLHALLPLVRLCDCLLEGDTHAAAAAGGGGAGNHHGRQEEAGALTEAVRLLGAMVRMPWWSPREATLGSSGRHRRRACDDADATSVAAGGDAAAGGAGGCGEDNGERSSVVGISERWTLLSTLTSLLRPENNPAYPGTSQQVNHVHLRTNEWVLERVAGMRVRRVRGPDECHGLPNRLLLHAVTYATT